MFWNIVIAVASYALNLVLAPKPQNKKPASLEDFNFPVAAEGTEIPVVFGTCYIKSPNVMWYGDLRVEPIKGERRYGFFGPRQVLGHHYFLGMHQILCHAVHDELREIWAGDKLIYPERAGSPDIARGNTVVLIDQLNVFGGDDREGGIYGFISLLGGGPGQTQSSYLAEQLAGADTPAFRGVVSVVWHQLYIGNSPYVKPWEFYLKRIHLTSRGEEQWYDEKAAVPDSHDVSSTGTGVELVPYVTTFNAEEKLHTNGEWFARVNEGTDGNYGHPNGALRVWHLPDGAEMEYDPPNPNAGYYPTGKFSSSVHITEWDEIFVMWSGSAWANVDVYMWWASAADPSVETQARFNLTDYFAAEGITTWSNLNWGFAAGERGNYLLTKFGPSVYPWNPWVLWERVGGVWTPVYTYEGSSVGGYSGGTYAISLGPRYAYALKGTWGYAGLGATRVQYHPDYAWEEVEIDVAALGVTGSVYAHAYNEILNVVVYYTSTGVWVLNEDLTVLLRSFTGPWPIEGYGPAWGTDSRCFWVTDTTFLVHLGFGDFRYLYEFDVVSMEIVRETNLSDSNYVNVDSWGSGPLLYNREVGGMVIGQHFLTPLSFWPYVAIDPLDMNPAHIIRECLTDPSWGMGYTAADIDDDSFTAAANVLWDECFGLSLQWTKEEKIEEFITTILAHIDAYLYLRRTTGKFYLKLVRNDYVIAELPEFDEDDVIDWRDVAHRAPAEAVNTVNVKYADRRANRGRDGSLQVDNISQIQALGERISAARYYPGISRRGLAAQVAARDQVSLGIGMLSGSIAGKRTFDALHPGDPFRLTSSRHGLEGEIMRVASLRFGDGRDNKIELRFLQDIFNLGTDELVDSSDGDWENPTNPPSAVIPRLVWEAPYRELLALAGPSDVEALLAVQPDAGMIEVAGVSPTSDALDALLYVDAVQADIMTFGPGGLLATDIGTFDTEITLTEDEDLDQIVVGTLAAILTANGDDWALAEIVRIDAVDGTTLTIARGLVDTIPRAHAESDWFVVFDDFQMSDFTARTPPAAPVVELLTRTGSGILSEALAPDDVVTLDTRAIRPLRPANVKVEGFDVGPVDVEGFTDVDVTWANRNRLTEIGDTIFEWTDATVTPEAGQTTVIEALDAAGTTVLTTHSGLAGTSFSVPIGSFLGGLAGWIRVGSERDGYREWQAYEIQVIISPGYAVGEAHGTGTALGYGPIPNPESVGLAAGTSTVVGVAAVPPVGAAAGTSTVIGVSLIVQPGVGSATGTGTCLGYTPISPAVGSAAGTSTATSLPLFVPEVLSSIWAHWDFSLMSEADTVAVATVPDQSGNSRTLTTSGSPTAKANAQNSLKGLNFAGTQPKFATFAASNSLTEGMFFAVNKAAASPASTSHGGICDMGSSDSLTNHYTYSGVVYSDFLSSVRQSAGAVTVNVWHQVLLWSAPIDWGHAMDGTNKYTTTTNAVAGRATASYLAKDASSSWTHQGEFGEVIITSEKLSTYDRQRMEGYLAHKWGLTASLPAGHPYKGTPPGGIIVAAALRLSQQYAETIYSGSANFTRLHQQYGEVIHSGSANLARLHQQYGEVIHSGLPSADADPYYGYVVLLAEYEGTNGSNTYSETRNGRALTMPGNVLLSSTFARFGGTSLRVSVNETTYADNLDWSLSLASGDKFVIEISICQNNRSGSADILGHWGSSGQFGWLIRLASTGDLTFYHSTTGSDVTGNTVSTGAMSDNVWYDFTISKDASNVMRVFRDGVYKDKFTPASSAWWNSTYTLTHYGISNNYLYVDHFRITRGTDRGLNADADYTFVNAPFPTSTGNQVRLGQQYAEVIHSHVDDVWQISTQTTPVSSSSGWSGYTIRIRIAAAELANIVGAHRIRVTLFAGTGNAATIGNAYVGYAAAAGDAYDFEATPRQLFFSGSAGATIPLNTSLVSDAVAFSGEASKDLLISVYFSGATHIAYQTVATNYTSYFKNANDASTVNATGYTLDVNDLMVGKVEFNAV